MIQITLFSASILVLALSCTQSNDKTSNGSSNDNDTTILKTKKINYDMKDFYPFKLHENDVQFVIMAETESPELYPKYFDFFQKHEYSGSGYCWQEHITQILEKLDPQLIEHIEFDPEAGGLFVYADSKENQIKFAELLSPIFADLSKLEAYVKSADRSRFDD